MSSGASGAARDPDPASASARPGPTDPARPSGGGWAPLRYPAFRRLWLAQFTSNVGSWMQTVAAQWVMIMLTRSPLLLSAIPAAGSIPVLLLGVPAGALGDLVDRRRLILVSQATMLLASALLAVLSATGALSPWVLIALLFVIGIGSASSASTWQTLQPELVPPAERAQAIALGSVNQNLARAVGPAIGGLLLAATSAAIVFSVNAASFVAVLAAVALTAIPIRKSNLPREHAVGAVRAGGRFVANSPVLLELLVRTVGFVFFSGAIWALLPLVAHHRLGLGSFGYGLLLGCVGVGALLAANFGPALRSRLSPRAIYTVACLVLTASSLALAATRTVAVAVAALIAAGAAWIIGLGLLSSSYQGQLPSWAKARAFSYYLVSFQGAAGIGSLAVGAIAQATSVATGLVVVGAGLAFSALATWRLALPTYAAEDQVLAEPMPLPDVHVEGDPGPVTVTVRYRVPPENTNAFIAAAGELRRLRRRTGAISWHLHRDLEDPRLFVENYMVGTWEEHERQHARLERSDQQLIDRIDGLLEPGTSRVPRHAIAVRVPRHPHTT